METSKPVRVRFAPSPTGPLHIGGVRTALYNYLLAKQHGGTMILRIEDTDQARFVPGAEEYIQESLKWLGIEINEGPTQGGPFAPYRQSERKESYAQYAYQLLNAGYAYYAFDTTEELEEMRKRLEASKMPSAYNATSRMSMKNSLTLSADEVNTRLQNNEPYVIRIKLPRKEDVRFFDTIRGWVVVNTSQMDDKVLLKGDGMPTYHLANVVDDYIMQISHVIRGEEWLPSAPLHVLLYSYLGWEKSMPQFAHLPLLLKPEGNGKLSKRDGDRLGFPVFPIQWKDPFTNEISSGYRENGYMPHAVVNMLALLGWHPSNNQEVFSITELIQQFSLEKVSKSGAKFDLNKALWFNHHYLMHTPVQSLLPAVQAQATEIGLQTTPQYLSSVIELMREKCNFLPQILTQGMYFFVPPTQFDSAIVEKKWNPQVAENLEKIATDLQNCEPFLAKEIEQAIQSTVQGLSISVGQIMQPLRLAISGFGVGPPFYEMLQLIGKENCIQRIQFAIKTLA